MIEDWRDQPEGEEDGEARTAERWERDISDLESEDWEWLLGGPEDDSLLYEEEGEEEEEEEEDEDEELECEIDGDEEAIDIAKRCVELKRMIVKLSDKLSMEKQHLLDRGMEIGNSLTVDGYRLLGCVVRRYSFSSEVRELKRELHQKKLQEIETGQASLSSETSYIRISRLLADIRTEYPRAGFPWTQEELDILNAEVVKGKPIRDISGLLGRRPGAIRSRLAQTNSADIGKVARGVSSNKHSSLGLSQGSPERPAEPEEDDGLPF